MRNVPTGPVLLAVLLAAGLFNFVTTCCCGHSTILEFLEGTCEPHDGEVQHAAGHPDGEQGPCHKGGGDSFLASSQPGPEPDQAACLPVAAVPPALGPGDQARSLSPAPFPSPDDPGALYLENQRWLI